MVRRRSLHVHRIAVALAIGVAAPHVLAQQQERAPWQTETQFGAIAIPAGSSAASPWHKPRRGPADRLRRRPTPRSCHARARDKTSAGRRRAGQVSLVALLTQDGQNIEQGLVWRVFRDKPVPDGKMRLVSTHREASPTLRLEAGDYFVNVAFGRAHLTRKITVSASARRRSASCSMPAACGSLPPSPMATLSTRRPSATTSTPMSATSTGNGCG